MIYIGIDPGKDGGIAWIDSEGAHAKPYSDEMLIAVLATAGNNCRCVLEKVSAMPGNGAVSMFHFGQSFGYIQGVLEAYGISYQLIPPKTWKKEYSLNSDKEKSVEVCRRLFPSVDLYRTEKCTKPHDGMAEALLMAEYARRKL